MGLSTAEYEFKFTARDQNLYTDYGETQRPKSARLYYTIPNLAAAGIPLRRR